MGFELRCYFDDRDRFELARRRGRAIGVVTLRDTYPGSARRISPGSLILVVLTAGAFTSIRRRLTPRHEERSNASAGPKLSPRIVEGIQATKSAISSGTTSGWGSSLALQELSGAIIGGTERFGGFDAMEATRATQPRPVNTKFGFVVATAVGDEVAEANFKPATALSFATETLRAAARPISRT